MNESVPVVVECLCEGTPHTEDTVWLAAKVSAPMGMAFMGAVKEGMIDTSSLTSATADMQALLTGLYLRFGPVRWTVVDAKSEPLPLTAANIEDRLPYGPAAIAIAEKADELYEKTLWRPLGELLQRLEKEAKKQQKPRSRRSPSNSLPTGLKVVSTSATHANGSARPMPSTPSSPSASAGRQSAAPDS